MGGVTEVNPDAIYKVKTAVFEYYVDSTAVHPTTGYETEQTAPRYAFRREILEAGVLREEDARRGLNRGEIVEVRRKAAESESEGPASDGIVGNNAEDIAAWLKSDKPTVAYLVEHVGDDAALAQLVLDAENIVTAESPRQTLVTALEKVISDPEDDEEEDDEEELDDEDES